MSSSIPSSSSSSSSLKSSPVQLPLIEISFSFPRVKRPEEEGGNLPEVNRTFQIFAPDANPMPITPMSGKVPPAPPSSSLVSELPSRIVAEPFDPNYVEPEALESNTSYKYSGRHDHGDLPILKVANQHLVDVRAAIREGEEHKRYFLITSYNLTSYNHIYHLQLSSYGSKLYVYSFVLNIMA